MNLALALALTSLTSGIGLVMNAPSALDGASRDSSVHVSLAGQAGDVIQAGAPDTPATRRHTASITGTVVDAVGHPLGGQRLELSGPAVASGLRLTTTSDERGRFVFRGLPPGRYVLDLLVEGRGVTSRPIELGPEAGARAEIIVVRPARAGQKDTPTAMHRHGLTVNPMFWLASLYNIEYERRRSPRTAWGASTTLSEWDDFRYRTVKALFRYYPARVPLHGLFVGARGGASRVSDRFNDSGLYGVAGVEFGFTTYHAPGQHVVASAGLGLNRLIGRNTGFLSPSRNFPALRLNVGVGF